MSDSDPSVCSWTPHQKLSVDRTDKFVSAKAQMLHEEREAISREKRLKERVS
jgi:hypothetical protein